MSQVTLTAQDLAVLAAHARNVGTQDAWMSVALEWIVAADVEIERLNEIIRLNEISERAANDGQ